MIEPEPVFGDMKNNRSFKRFLLQGLPKVSLEVGWLSLAHNLLKKRWTPKAKELSENRPLSSLVYSVCHPILLLKVFQSLLLGQPRYQTTR